MIGERYDGLPRERLPVWSRRPMMKIWTRMAVRLVVRNEDRENEGAIGARLAQDSLTDFAETS